jgi:methionyl-tRNA formyltransferase
MGTPEFAIAPLEKLIADGHNIKAVITAPDKPAGRGQKMQYSDVKKFALEKQLTILQPEKFKNPEFLKTLKDINADLFAVVAFRMLPEEVWSMPRLGTINLHASLLPQYRGAAPINWAIINGETETGVTTFLIEKEIDTGHILYKSKVEIEPTENAGSLHDKLMVTGAKLLSDTIKELESGNTKPTEQKALINIASELKPAPKIKKEDCRINWNKKTEEIFNLIRGLSPYPSAWSVLQNNSDKSELQVKIYETEIYKGTGKTPGAISTDNKTYIEVATSEGCLRIKSLQIEGKKKLATEELLRGFHNLSGYSFV